MMVRVVLDESALLAYARLHGVAVGELLLLVAEDGGLVGVSAAAFLSAYPLLNADERVRLVDLVASPDGVTVVLPLLGGDVAQVAEIGDSTAGQVSGHAVLEAHRRNAQLLTDASKAARTVLDEDLILDL